MTTLTWSPSCALRVVTLSAGVTRLEQWWQLQGVGLSPDYRVYTVRGEWRPVPVVPLGNDDPPTAGEREQMAP